VPRLALALLLACVPFDARAFTLNHQSLEIQGWRDRPLVVDYDFSACPALLDGVQLVDVLGRAIDLWNSVIESELRIELGSPVSITASEATSRAVASNPVVLCDPSLSASIGLDSNQIPGSTVNQRVDGSGAIVTSAMLLNAESGKVANIGNLAVLRLQLLLAHELSHVLGLGHSPDTSALMYFDITDKAEVSLAQDDYDGIAYLYPRKELLNAGFLGCGTLRSGAGPGAPPPELALLFLLCATGWGLVRRPVRR
jgi:hypothetical protein